MMELRFNDEFNGIIEVPINCWKTFDDIPQKIKDFITETSNSIPIFDESNNKYYCPKCVKEINEKKMCEKCSKIFKLHDESSIENIKELRNYQNDIYYYIFDIKDGNILLYLLCEHIDYYNPLVYYPYKHSKINIENIYQILPKEIINIKSGKHILYKNIDTIYTKFINEDLNNDEFEIYEELEFNTYEHQYLYTDNLKDLKNTNLYRYSNIWTLEDYFKEHCFTLASLIFYPVYYREFEYLLKMKLYALAINYCSYIKYRGSFENTFGVEKKYYSFMKDIDITGPQLDAFRLYHTTDINILTFIVNNYFLVELILKYVSLDKVLEYLDEQGLSIKNLYEYEDYIRCCEEMKLNLKDHNILFPKQFIKQHDKITNEMIITKDPQTDKRIKNLSNILFLNKYEDDKYIIFAADSINSLVDESSQQSNCVRTYCDMVSNNSCQVYFMRYKNDITKSFITIEVRNNKVVQAKTRFNEEPPIEAMNIIRKWEQTLIPIINE